MLALPMHRHPDLIVFGDDADPSRMYVAADRPHLERDAEGRARLRLVRWTRSDGRPLAGPGGRLNVDATIAPAGAALAAAGLDPQAVLPIPWLDVSIRLEGPGFDPVDVTGSRAAGDIAVLSADLPADGVARLAPVLAADAVLPLQVTWIGHVLLRLPAVQVVAVADVDDVRRRVEAAGRDRHVTVVRSILDARAHVQITGSTNPELEASLRAWALDELTARMASGGDLSVRASAADVVAWPIRLPTTLDDLMAPADRDRLVETVVLDADEIGEAPPIDVRALGVFGTDLERIDVALEAPGEGLSRDVVLTDDRITRVGMGTNEVRWRHRLKRRGAGAAPWTPWTEAAPTSQVVIPVTERPPRAIDVLSAGLDFTQRWASVRVTLTPADGDERATTGTVVLTAAQPQASWQPTDEPGPLTARAVFTSAQGQTIARDLGAVVGTQVLVADPFERGRVRMAVVPAGSGWPGVAMAMVDLRYEDDGYRVDETVALKTIDDFVEWEAPARPDGPRVVSWRAHISLRDGAFSSGDWQTTTGGLAIVTVDRSPRREVQILPIYFDPAVTPKGILRLESQGQVTSVEITSRERQDVTLVPGPYSWTLGWTTADGVEQPLSPPREGDDVIVVPRYTED